MVSPTKQKQRDAEKDIPISEFATDQIGTHITMTRSRLMIRMATEDDAQAISDIYNHYVEVSTCTFDLERETLDKRIAWLHAHGSSHPVIVCDCNAEIVGWGSLSQWNARPAYSRTAEVSFYVHQSWHRQGIGRLLLTDLIARARALGHRVLIGGACTEQLASIKLQEAFGFTQVASFSNVGYKFDRWLDVAYFQLTLDSPKYDG
jgi:phosphinothricin acetyltransferase